MVWLQVLQGSGAWVYKYMANGYPTNSIAIRTDQGDLAIISPPLGLSGPDFAEIDAKGRVTALVAPSSSHDLGQAEWQARYPNAIPYAASIALERLKPVRQPYVPLSRLSSPLVEFRELPGTKIGEMIAIAHHGQRPVVYLGELIVNWTSLPNARGRISFWVSGSAPGLHVNRVYTRGPCYDLQALARAVLDALGSDPAIVPAHGVPLVRPGDAARVRALLDPLEESVSWLNSGWRGWRVRLQGRKRRRDETWSRH